jgi:flagellar biosynthesis anti-sigma factor FlgM
MKVDLNSSAAIQMAVERAPKQVSNSGLTGTQGATEDRTTFSTDSAGIQALTAQALNSPQIRQDKVDALKQAVSNGSYPVNATNIASAIAENKGE